MVRCKPSNLHKTAKTIFRHHQFLTEADKILATKRRTRRTVITCNSEMSPESTKTSKRSKVKPLQSKKMIKWTKIMEMQLIRVFLWAWDLKVKLKTTTICLYRRIISHNLSRSNKWILSIWRGSGKWALLVFSHRWCWTLVNLLNKVNNRRAKINLNKIKNNRKWANLLILQSSISKNKIQTNLAYQGAKS